MCRPRLRFPVTAICGRAVSLAIPFVNTSTTVTWAFNITNNANQPALSGLQRAANLPPGDRRFLAIPAACSSAYASNGEKLALPMGARLHCDPALFYCQESAFPA